ncbi:Alpha/Beta hydrolase protein [Lasiosphaeria miniovina]|uniref:Alpha/Beta hydrolase protein n=1 Tax=Lasiosphaeria miniovina TaxID=1954250 RepID=A0AA40E738_9PEZI|nr:Alpha/Beta hydrolase protein [Lasiosphaeria miniovina]KAK0727477.1 Alpha/Beta hydrolase protein [Lasiosphaeria miniovina]
MGLFSRSNKAKKESPTLAPSSHRGVFPQNPLPTAPPTHVSRSWFPGDASQPQAPFQSAGLLPPPVGWTPHPPALFHQPAVYSPPIIVNQHHYYLGPPANGRTASKLNLGSVVDLAKEICPNSNFPPIFDDGLPRWHGYSSQLLNQSAAMADQISSRFNDVVTLIDCERYAGNEGDLFTWQPGYEQQLPTDMNVGDKGLLKPGKKNLAKGQPKGQTTAVAASVMSGSFFAKVDLYSNSKLPMNLPPLRLYIPTYPLLCLAARYSERVYERLTGAERDAHVDADWRTGSKAMVIKSVPMDYMNTIVFAIRGTATFMDWAVNLNTAPASPAGFLDDPGNLCHAGFLSAARKMISPVARRLRQLLEEDPGRASYSLLITGHSAGGAVAALLYSHMLATSKAAESELNILTGCFKRVHCIIFGTPPVSLMPLTKPEDYDSRPHLKKSLFLSFINEGDPVARADKAYVRSLLELFAAPAPTVGTNKKEPSSKRASWTKSTTGTPKNIATPGPVWKVPPSTLSSAGRIVVLRCGDPNARLKGKKTVEERLNEGVVAQIATDEQLREVIWGDPVCHVMRLYAGRIETLAVGAVTAKGY